MLTSWPHTIYEILYDTACLPLAMSLVCGRQVYDIFIYTKVVCGKQKNNSRNVCSGLNSKVTVALYTLPSITITHHVLVNIYIFVTLWPNGQLSLHPLSCSVLFNIFRYESFVMISYFHALDYSILLYRDNWMSASFIKKTKFHD